MRRNIAIGLLTILAVSCARMPGSPQKKGPSAGKEPAVVIQGNSYTENEFQSLLGLKMKEAINKLGLDKAESFWVDEPPFQLRGMFFVPGDGTSVMLLLDYDDPMFKAHSEAREWDRVAFLQGKLVGIQASSEGAKINVGNVPSYW